MIKFIGRLTPWLYKKIFFYCYKWSFKKIGFGVAIFRPFRIDGGHGISIGHRTIFQRGAWLYCCSINDQPALLTIGDGCIFGYNNHITAVGRVNIGDCVLTANNVYISDNLHGYEDVTVPIMHQPVRFKREVVVGDGSWIGENVCIIGAHIGRNCVIGANSVVTSDIPDYSVAVGAPAVVIRRFDQSLQKWMPIKS